MKKTKITWIIGSVLCASLVVSAPANAAKNGRVAAAKRYHVTQISERDVTLARTPGAGTVPRARFSRSQALDSDVLKAVLVPNPDSKPDMQLTVVRPNEDTEKTVLLPNPDSKPDSQ